MTDTPPDRAYKRCTKCRQWQPRRNFATHRHTLDGLQSWCRECKRVGMARYREKGRR